MRIGDEALSRVVMSRLCFYCGGPMVSAKAQLTDAIESNTTARARHYRAPVDGKEARNNTIAPSSRSMTKACRNSVTKTFSFST